jgi:hypothetical protein
MADQLTGCHTPRSGSEERRAHQLEKWIVYNKFEQGYLTPAFELMKVMQCLGSASCKAVSNSVFWTDTVRAVYLYFLLDFSILKADSCSFSKRQKPLFGNLKCTR